MSLVNRLNGALRHVPAGALYLIAVLPPIWFLWQGISGRLGVDPVRALEWKLGRAGLQLLVASLAITPLRRLAGLNLIRFRRAIALAGFSYILLHLLTWLVLDVQIPAQIGADILKRPYITIGMAALVLMLPLALTSNDLSLRRLGPLRWRRLHRLVYPAMVLAGVHYVMIAKVWDPRALAYLGAVLGLLALRLRPGWGRPAMRRRNTR